MNDKPEKTDVFKDLKFRVIGIATLILLIIVLSMMFYNLDFIWRPNELSWYTSLIETFRLPLGMLTTGIAILSLYAVFYKLKLTEKQILQTQEQIRISQKTTTLSQYLEHKKYVHQRFGELEDFRGYGIYIPNKNALYNALFPKNSPRTFELPVETNEAKYLTHKFLGDWQIKIQKALAVINNIGEYADEQYNDMLFSNVYSNLLLDMGEYGITFKSEYSINKIPVAADGSYPSTISAIISIFKVFSELTFYDDFTLTTKISMHGETYFSRALTKVN
tara:strand:- start:274 stop:1104 length:831 start_codon:yes stop_codon:yes gene_type:complete